MKIVSFSFWPSIYSPFEINDWAQIIHFRNPNLHPSGQSTKILYEKQAEIMGYGTWFLHYGNTDGWQHFNDLLLMIPDWTSCWPLWCWFRLFGQVYWISVNPFHSFCLSFMVVIFVAGFDHIKQTCSYNLINRRSRANYNWIRMERYNNNNAFYTNSNVLLFLIESGLF